MPTYSLSVSGSAPVDATGTALVDIQVPTMQSWSVNRISVSVSTNAAEPEARVYVDSVSPGNRRAGTYTGSMDDSDENLALVPGQHLLCQWTGGDPGATATLSVFGMRQM